MVHVLVHVYVYTCVLLCEIDFRFFLEEGRSSLGEIRACILLHPCFCVLVRPSTLSAFSEFLLASVFSVRKVTMGAELLTRVQQLPVQNAAALCFDDSSVHACGLQ